VTHGLKARASTRIYLRKRNAFEFCDTSATRMRRDIPAIGVIAGPGVKSTVPSSYLAAGDRSGSDRCEFMSTD
jgi:hypothetical protein